MTPYDCCCQIAANCTPEIVKFTPGFLGDLTIRMGCEMNRYLPWEYALFASILFVIFGLVLGYIAGVMK